MNEEVLVFTYGSLKRGFFNHGMLRDAENVNFVAEAKTIEKYQMYPCTNFAFPFVIKSETENRIKGEVFSVKNDKVLELLDILEDAPVLYFKDYVQVELDDGKTVTAMMYFKNEEAQFELMDRTKPLSEWTKEVSSAEV